MHLQAYEWVVLGVAAVLLVLPAVKKIPSVSSWVRGLFAAKAPEKETADAAAIVRQQHSLYCAFRFLRGYVLTDQPAVDSLDRLVLPAIVSGKSDARYHVTWDGAATPKQEGG